MQIADALECLSVNRVIWVDDLFKKTPRDLADMLINAYETALECGFDDIAEILATTPYDEDAARIALAEQLNSLTPERNEEIRAIFLEREAGAEEFKTAELPEPSVSRVRELLGISEGDCWTFDKAAAEIPAVCGAGDGKTAYVIDLNEAGGSSRRGLEILVQLRDARSQGTAFILTHEAQTTTEASKESELRGLLVGDGYADALTIPICVIAKGRLLTPEDDNTLQEAIRTSIKRAGLSKNISVVVSEAQKEIHGAFLNAANALLSVPAEQIEEFVVERGYAEGVSELHVVERILSSQMAKKLREFFGTNNTVLESAYRLRELRKINLSEAEGLSAQQMMDFRLAEVWESKGLINNALAPIACGDVFETDTDEPTVRSIKRKFLLLAQPCDIALRPEGKSRNRDLGFLVPLKKLRNLDKVRTAILPCKVDDAYWECDFADTSMVHLSVLDLASFRPDGRVCFEENQAKPQYLVASQARVYEKRVEGALKLLNAGQGDAALPPSLQLSLTWDRDFKHFYFGKLCDAVPANKDSGQSALTKRVTWKLRRAGRVRMPFAAGLLEHYLSDMTRRAFDVDFMAPREKATSEAAAKAEAAKPSAGG